MPDDVFEQWISPKIDYNGWPFCNPDEPMTKPGWAKEFRYKTLEFWSNVSWEIHTIKFINLNIEEVAKNKASEIVQNWKISLKSKNVPKACITDSSDRFMAIAKFVRDNGKLPKPIICLVNRDELYLLDGYHRLSVMFAFSVQDDFPVSVWIGSQG